MRQLLLLFGASITGALKTAHVKAAREGDIDVKKTVVQLPDNYDKDKKHMLVVLLPGYGDGYPEYTKFYGLALGGDALLAGKDTPVIQLLAEGRTDTFGHMYWMAWGGWTGSCSPEASYTYDYWYDSQGDNNPLTFTDNEAWQRALDYCGGGDVDVDYILALVSKAQEKFNIDPKQIFALGQSNGAAMAYRLACQASEVFSAVVAIEGSPPPDSYGCAPSSKVRVLHIHGTADRTVKYKGNGDDKGTGYLGAYDSCSYYLGFNGCSAGAMPRGAALSRRLKKNKDGAKLDGITRMMDISDRTDGEETEVYRAEGDCADGDGAVELWKVVGETHSPWFNSKYAAAVLAWLDGSDRGGGDAPACEDVWKEKKCLKRKGRNKCDSSRNVKKNCQKTCEIC